MGLIPLAIAITITYIQRVNAANIRSEDKISAIRDLKVTKLNRWVEIKVGDLNVMSGDYEIRSLESIFNSKQKRTIKENDQLKIAEELLNRNFRNSNEFNEVYIINSSTGKIELSTNRNHIGRVESIHNYFKKVMKTGTVFIEKMHFSIYTNKAHLTFSKPILCLEHGTHIIGVLVVDINIDKSINKILFDRVGLGETGETLIVNKDVIVLNELRWRKNATLKLKIEAEPAIRAVNGKTGVVISEDYRGEKVMAAYTYIPRMEWGFVSKQDMSELNAPIIRMLHESVMLFIASAIAIFILSITISNSISKPIIFLDNTAKKISRGNYSVTPTIQAKDELGSLSKSVNKMIVSLKIKDTVQKGVENISSKIMEQTSLHQFSSDIINELKKITNASSVAFYVLNELSSNYEPFVSLGIEEKMLKPLSILDATSNLGKTFNAGNVLYQTNYSENAIFNLKEFNDSNIPRELITIPIKVEDIVVAFIILINDNSFAIENLQIVKQSLLNINTSYSSLISNLRVGILAENVLKVNDALDDKSKILSKKNIELLNQTVIANEANKELESFAYSVSHDLRAPLRHIDGFTKLLYNNIKTGLDKKTQGYFDNIINSSKQMNQLIDDLLTFSRMNRKELNKKKIKMNTVVNGALHTFDLDIKNSKVKIVVDDLSKVRVDAALMSYVWINLISNAIKFTSKTKNPKIHIGIDKQTDEETIYFIKDNGVGFNQKYVEKIFGVFQRLHTSNEFPGTGIGLANVKRIITKHNGSMQAEGEINKGAAFYITLPKT